MIGVDPEFFILDTKGKPVPAWKFFPPKENKMPAGTGSFFRDGYALELNTPAETCRARLGNALRETMRVAQEQLPRGYRLSTQATIQINKSDMAGAPTDCQVFGCDPSYNAYTGKEFTVDIDAMSHQFRYAGGHMHCSSEYKDGFTKNRDTQLMFAKLCDLFIGLPLAYLFDTPDEVQRRQYYGRAGECRLTRYPNWNSGVEYRTPSPKLWNHHEVATLFFGVMRKIQGDYAMLAAKWCTSWEKPLQKAINLCQVDPKMLPSVYGFYTPELLQTIKRDAWFTELVFPNKLGDCHTAYTELVSEKLGGSYPGRIQLGYKFTPSGDMLDLPTNVFKYGTLRKEIV